MSQKKLSSVKQTGSASKSVKLNTPFTDAIVTKSGGASPKPTQPKCCKS